MKGSDLDEAYSDPPNDAIHLSSNMNCALPTIINLVIDRDEKYLAEDHFMLDSLNDRPEYFANIPTPNPQLKDNPNFVQSLSTAISYFEQCEAKC